MTLEPDGSRTVTRNPYQLRLVEVRPGKWWGEIWDLDEMRAVWFSPDPCPTWQGIYEVAMPVLNRMMPPELNHQMGAFAYSPSEVSALADLAEREGRVEDAARFRGVLDGMKARVEEAA